MGHTDSTRRYTVLLTPDPDEGGYTVTVPALPGCITEGDTLVEGLANVREAIKCHLDGLLGRASAVHIPADERR